MADEDLRAAKISKKACNNTTITCRQKFNIPPDINCPLADFMGNDCKVSELSLHTLIIRYLKQSANINADEFIEYCKSVMPLQAIRNAEQNTILQSNSKLWYELRYARVTASKIYEASRCKTAEGALFNQIMGAAPPFDSPEMERGRRLEEAVLKKLRITKKIKIKKTGLILCRDYPILGASPDGLTTDFVIEVKCPSKEKTVENYIKGGNITDKYLAQIQLQMLFAAKKKGLFVVAAPDYEQTQNITEIMVDFDEDFIKNVIEMATDFWKNAIFKVLSNYKIN